MRVCAAPPGTDVAAVDDMITFVFREEVLAFSGTRDVTGGNNHISSINQLQVLPFYFALRYQLCCIIFASDETTEFIIIGCFGKNKI